MKIGLFGGCFDPITIAHITVANAVLDNNLVDEVWLLPAYRSLYNKTFKVSDKQRIEMCNLAILDNCRSNIKLFSYEIDNELVESSLQVISRIKKDFPDKKFYFIIGTDNAINLHKWNNYEKLINEITFIIVPRNDYNVNDSFHKLGLPHIYLKCDNIYGSSTQVRNDIRKSSYLISSKVKEYIEENKLYEILS